MLLPTDKRDRTKKNKKTMELKIKGSPSDFEQMIEKQLKDDFEVQQYLDQVQANKFDESEYISLFNKLLASKTNKRSKKEFLDSLMNLSNSKHGEGAEEQMNDAYDIYYTEEEYESIKKESEEEQEIIEIKIKRELEIERILWKEIMDNKKSLNLLKGDIGHLIARNESIKTLESKMSKVSLVASNQLKRMQMALSKDKNEIRTRYDMQKDFHQKMKNMQSVETGNLKRLKSNYVQTIKRKKEIFEKLQLIEKECASIEEYSDKSKMKNSKNARSLGILELLKKLCELIDGVPTLNRLYENKTIEMQEYVHQIKCLSENKLEQKMKRNSKFELLDSENLTGFSEKIIEEYDRLHERIRSQTNFSNELIKRLEEQWSILSNCETSREELFKQMNEDEKDQLLCSLNFQDYFLKLKEFFRSLKAFYLLIEFVSNRIDSELPVTQHISTLNQLQAKLSVFGEYKPETLILEENVFAEIAEELKSGFDELCGKVLNQYSIRVPQEPQAPESKRGSMLVNTREDRFGFDEGYDVESEKSEMDEINEINPIVKETPKTEKKSLNEKKMDEDCARRLKLLEGIDLNYYKMIKSTLEMEKENTRKNYEFLKTFKRTKYSTQDQILEQKRFQASFSGVFSQQRATRDNNILTVNSNSRSESRFKLPTKKDKYQSKKAKTEGRGCLRVPVRKTGLRNSILRKTEANNKIRELLEQI